jgi:AcrR family transcriptional regulator
MTPPRSTTQRRNRGFDDTHQEMIETAVRLISEKGVEALSIAALSRAMGINRTTVYYHFEHRQALIEAVTNWSSRQLAKGMDHGEPQPDRMGFIDHFVVDNPELIKLWIEGFVSGDDIRKSYPGWDALVEGMKASFATNFPGEEFDAEAYSTIMLTGAIVGLRVFRNSVAPDADTETVLRRFMAEQRRQLRRDRLMD